MVKPKRIKGRDTYYALGTSWVQIECRRSTWSLVVLARQEGVNVDLEAEKE